MTLTFFNITVFFFAASRAAAVATARVLSHHQVMAPVESGDPGPSVAVIPQQGVDDGLVTDCGHLLQSLAVATVYPDAAVAVVAAPPLHRVKDVQSASV